MTRRSKATLKEEYLRWLEPQIRDEYGNPEKTYWDLVTFMFEKEFRWVESVSMDENRVMDGLDLRVSFAREHGLRANALDFLGPGSFLEVLIALSRRLAFNAGGNAPGWAWHLLNNLDLQRMWDPLTRYKANKAEDIMDTVIERRYSPEGKGGFFPLLHGEEDLRQIELWYQMHIYIEELHTEPR